MDKEDVGEIAEAVRLKMLDAHAEDKPANVPGCPPGPSGISLAQSIVAFVLALITVIGIGWNHETENVRVMDAIRERVVKTEYQNQLSIDDRAALHVQANDQGRAIGDIKSVLASMNAKLDEIMRKQQ